MPTWGSIRVPNRPPPLETCHADRGTHSSMVITAWEPLGSAPERGGGRGSWGRAHWGPSMLCWVEGHFNCWVCWACMWYLGCDLLPLEACKRADRDPPMVLLLLALRIESWRGRRV